MPPPGPLRMDPVRSIGVSCQPLPEGLEVVHLLSGGPGERAGLRKGDILIGVDGIAFADMGCLRQGFRDSSVGSKLLSFLRDGEVLEVPVMVEVLVP